MHIWIRFIDNDIFKKFIDTMFIFLISASLTWECHHLQIYTRQSIEISVIDKSVLVCILLLRSFIDELSCEICVCNKKTFQNVLLFILPTNQHRTDSYCNRNRLIEDLTKQKKSSLNETKYCDDPFTGDTECTYMYNKKRHHKRRI